MWEREGEREGGGIENIYFLSLPRHCYLIEKTTGSTVKTMPVIFPSCSYSTVMSMALANNGKDTQCEELSDIPNYKRP